MDMRKAVKELIEFMEDLGAETLRTNNLGLEFEGMTLDYVVLMEKWRTHEKSISFVNGFLDDDDSMWLNSEEVQSDASVKMFDDLCEQVIELM